MSSRVFLIPVLLLTPLRALACEAGICVQSFWPTDGAVDVPTNAEIWLAYDVAGDFVPSVVLLDAEDQPVETSEEIVLGGDIELVRDAMLRVTPAEPLAAGATIAAVWNIPDSVCSTPSVTTFTTGIDDDSMAPESPGDGLVSASFNYEVPATGSCEAGVERYRYAVSLSDVDDALAYELLHNGDVVDIATEPELVYDVLFEEGGPTEPPEDCFSIVAIDPAGNESAPSESLCLESDDTADTADEILGYDHVGCFPGCAATSPPGVLSSLVGAMLSFGLARRRQSTHAVK